MTEKTLNTLVEDVYELFNPDKTHEPNEDNLNEVAENIKQILRIRLAQREDVKNPLRFSSIGKPDRQIWFMAHPDGTEEKLTSKTFFKFLYGDVIEQLLLFLCKESGHRVQQVQGEVNVDGVKGHIDAIIDDVVVDVKSASPFGYKKFENNSVLEDDPFGYVQQLAGYSSVLRPGQSAAWLAFDKVAGDICVTPLSSTVIKDFDVQERVDHLREVIKQDTPPPLCYNPIPDGESGNMKLPTPCSYCVHKKKCHPQLRTFLYSNGPKFLTRVVKVPKVPEITNE